MSFYSDEKIKTEIIDPHYYSANDRVEFRLDRGTLLNNLYLGNFGAVETSNAQNQNYNVDCGVKALIKNIHLYDGKVSLQSVYNANDVYVFREHLNSNSYNGLVGKVLVKHQGGFTIEGKLVPNNYSIREKGVESAPLPNVDSDTNQNKGLLDVRHLLPILKVLPCLPSKVFKDLRLVVEYETKLQNFTTRNDNTVVTTKPIMIIDRVVDETVEANLIGKLGNASFVNYEFTSINAPAVASGIQEISQRVATYNNKFLSRLRIIKQFQNEASYINGNVNRFNGRGKVGSSLNLHEEDFNVRVNGKNILPRGKIDADFERLAMLTDTYGRLNMLHEGVQTFVSNGNDDAQLSNNGIISFDRRLQGTQDYNGLRIGSFIDELVVELKRSFIADATNPSQYKDALKIVIEGEVMKQITFQDGGYVVGYVSQ